MKNIAILGSTGSIGQQALEVIENYPERFSVEVLTAYNSFDLLIEQAIKFHPNVVVIGNEAKYDIVRQALKNYETKVYAGANAIAQVVEMGSIDLVLTAMVGYSGLIPTVNAIKAGKNIALANKETLVVAGDLVNRLAIDNMVDIIPVDSEHSAIFQCLIGESLNQVEKVFLTCSGGPFHGMDNKMLEGVKVQDALKHPNWEMGAKITIDSATLMNKGFEVIEAKWLFGLTFRQIEVVVHPQSIIHSMVQFNDGSIKAQMGLPDMRLPIQYALSFPERIMNTFQRLNFMDLKCLTFSAPNTKIFRNLALAYEALQKGGNLACILNASNEVAVDAFLSGNISFTDIWVVNEQIMGKSTFISHPSLTDYIDSDQEARKYASEMIRFLQFKH